MINCSGLQKIWNGAGMEEEYTEEEEKPCLTSQA